MRSILVPVAVLLLASEWRCQAEEEDRFLQVFVKMEAGRLAVDRIADTNTPPILAGYGMPAQELERILTADLNKYFATLPPLYCGAYGVKGSGGDTCPPETSSIKTFTGDWATFTDVFEKWRQQDTKRFLTLGQLFKAAFYLDKLSEIGKVSPLIWSDSESQLIDTPGGRLVFSLGRKVQAWGSCDCSDAQFRDCILIEGIKEGPSWATEEQLRKLLNPYVGGPWRPEVFRSVITDFYGPERQILIRENENTFGVATSESGEPARCVRVREGYRLAELVAPPPAEDSGAVRAVYLMLPDRDFRVLGTTNQITWPEGKRPLLSLDFLSQAAALASIGYTIDLLEMPQAGGLRSAQIRKADKPPEVTADESQARVPAAGALSEFPLEKPGLGAARQRQIGVAGVRGGFGYRPGQGVRARSRVYLRKTDGTPQEFSFDAGAAQENILGSFDYSADFVGFRDSRSRRVTLGARAGSDFQNQRQFGGVEADERRYQASARAAVELFRDRDRQWLSVFTEAGRTNVSVLRSGLADEVFKLTTVDTGASWYREAERLQHGWSLSFQPRLRSGFRLLGSRENYRIASGQMTYRQTLSRLLEARIYATGAQAGRGTPLVELPSFGGAESVRGFRADEALGRRLWSLRNELWVRSPFAADSKSPVVKFLREQVIFAPLLDFGGLYQARTGKSGERAGAGGGLRIRVHRMVYLKLDYAFGFGVEQGRPRGRFYLSADTDPR